MLMEMSHRGQTYTRRPKKADWFSFLILQATHGTDEPQFGDWSDGHPTGHYSVLLPMTATMLQVIWEVQLRLNRFSERFVCFLYTRSSYSPISNLFV